MDKFVLSGPDDISGIPHDSIGKLFSEIFNTFDEDIIAVVDVSSGRSMTYKQLCQLGKNLAVSLRLLGVGKDDTIGLVAENSREFVIVYLAALFLAAPVHLINPQYTECELENTLNLSRPVIVFCSTKSQQNVTKVVKKIDFVKIVVCLDLEKMSTQASVEFQLEDNINAGDHTAVICNSSGMTGPPKGVMVTHEMLRLQLTYGRDPNFYGLSPGKTLPIVSPLFDIYSLSSLNAGLYSGATLVVMDQFEPSTFLESIQKYTPERLHLVPSLVKFLLDSPAVGKHDLESVKQICSGGCGLTQEEAETLKQRLNLEKFHTSYGMAETGVVLHTSDGLNGSAGRILSGFDMKILDIETGVSLPPLRTGEICIKGTIMKGYIDDLEKTNEIIDSDGFLHSGDIGYYDKDGFFYIGGRMKDLIKYKSCRISPSELEKILLGYQGIKEVVVVGKPDPRFGELPTAFVVKDSGANIREDEIRDYVAGRVSSEKRLHGGVRFVEILPRNSSGEVLRRELVKQITDHE